MKKVFILIITSFFIYFGCKKKEERNLIKYYEGDYIGTRTTSFCCGDSGHTIYTIQQVELEVKKSIRGIKIKGVEVYDNFNVDYTDSTFSAHTKNSDERTNGKNFPNDSMAIYVSLSSKLPNGYLYEMKKK